MKRGGGVAQAGQADLSGGEATVVDKPSQDDRRVDRGALVDLATEVFRSCGPYEPDSALLADSLVRSDLRGMHSHGVLRVPEHVKTLTLRGVNPPASRLMPSSHLPSRRS